VETELDLRDYWNVIRKRIWMIAGIVLVATAATGVFSYFFIDPVYEASTKLIVNRSSDQTTANPLDLNEVNTNLRLIDTYKEIIKTTAITDIVAREYPQFGMTSEQIARAVKVSSVNNTQVMTLKVEHTSYEKAAQIVNAVSYVFQREIPKIFKIDNVSILNEAKLSPAPAPIKPNVKLNIAISLVVSLMIAVGLAFLLEYLDDTIKTEADVEKYLGLPTLGVIVKWKPEDFSEPNSAKKTVRQKGEAKSHVPISEQTADYN
jgi:capsular polysaccharide biosynthesis protein